MAFNKIRRMKTVLFYERRVNEFKLPTLSKLRLGEEIHYRDIGGNKHWGERKMLS